MSKAILFRFIVVSLLLYAAPAGLTGSEADTIDYEKEKCDIELGDWQKDAGWIFDEFVENLRGSYKNSWGYGDEVYGRTRNKKNPGDYLSPPPTGKIGQRQPSEEEAGWIKMILKENMGDKYYCPQMVSFCYSYDRVLMDSSRTEYFGTLEINRKKLALGGWFGKIAVFGFFDHYDGVDEFLEKSSQYFKLPHIAEKDVKIQRRGDKHFYSVLDRDGGYWLRGYRLVLGNIETKEQHPWDVIELLKFYDKEFVP